MTQLFLSSVTELRYEAHQALLSTDTIEDTKRLQGYIQALSNVLELDLELSEEEN